MWPASHGLDTPAVNYVQMNVNEIVKEVSKNVIDNITSSISTIENKSNKQFDDPLVFQLSNPSTKSSSQQSSTPYNLFIITPIVQTKLFYY